MHTAGEKCYVAIVEQNSGYSSNGRASSNWPLGEKGREENQADQASLSAQLDTANVQLETLRTQGKETQTALAEMETSLKPFKRMASKGYPGIDEAAALRSLADKMDRIISAQEQREPHLRLKGVKADTLASSIPPTMRLTHSFAPSGVNLTDVTVNVRFANPVSSFQYYIHGAISVDQGTRHNLHPDNRGFDFYTEILKWDNQLIIIVTCELGNEVVSMELSP
jgi:hypothetical protein